MLHNRTPTTYQLDELLIANYESNNSATITIQNIVKALRIIGLKHTISFYLRNFTMP
jgi:hypothetical protein